MIAAEGRREVTLPGKTHRITAAAVLALSLALGVAAPVLAEGPAAGVGTSYRIPYRLTETNHYLVRVRVNGKGPFNFLVDSGAPALYISTDAAKQIGLVPPEDDFWTPVERLDLEGGASLSGLKARVEDPYQLVGMNALGLPGAKIDGILGFTVLGRFRMEFDPTSDRMTWTKLDFVPKEPFVPRHRRNARGSSTAAGGMEALGPLMRLMAAFVGKRPEDRLIPRGRLGLELAAAGAEGRVRVAGVLPGSPAAEAGVEPGDRIESLNGRDVEGLDDAHRAVAELQPGTVVELVVRRGDDPPRTVSLTAAEGF